MGTVRVFHSVTSDRRVQCSRVWLEVKIYDTPAGGISASQGTFSSQIWKKVENKHWSGTVTVRAKILPSKTKWEITICDCSSLITEEDHLNS